MEFLLYYTDLFFRFLVEEKQVSCGRVRVQLEAGSGWMWEDKQAMWNGGRCRRGFPATSASLVEKSKHCTFTFWGGRVAEWLAYRISNRKVARSNP